MFDVIIQARMNSNRLPAKVLLPVNGVPILGHMLNRVKLCKSVNRIIVATTNNTIDEEIFNYAQSQHVLVYRGSEIDVLDRYYNAAVKFDSRNIIRLTSDCPLVDHRIIDEMSELFKNKDYDYLANTCPPPGCFPNGMDVEIFTIQALKRAFLEAKLPSEREHVTFYFWKSGKFHCHRFEKDFNYSRYRVTLDYFEDYELIRSVIQYFNSNDFDFSLSQLVKYLEDNPDLTKYQLFIDRESGWYDSLSKDKELLPEHWNYNK